MSFWQQFDPRRHVAAAIAWSVFLVVTLAALVAADLAAARAERRARADAEGLLAELATQVRDAVSMNLETRRSLLQAAAAQIAAADDRGPAAERRILDAVQAAFPEFVWLGSADAEGRLRAETAGTLAGASVATEPWFVQGRSAPHVAALFARAGASAPLLPVRVDFAVPLRPRAGSAGGAGGAGGAPGGAAGGAVGGVLVAHLDWPWVERVLTKMQAALSQHRQIEVMVASREGEVIAGPAAWLGQRLSASADLTEGGRYVVGTRTQLRLADGLGLGWTAIVRQSADAALAPVRSTRRTVFLIVFSAGLLSAAAAAWATRLLTRRLSRLAVQADAVRTGQQGSLGLPAGQDDVSRIGAALVQLVGHLQSEKGALQRLNAELDQRVAERTRQIERMADEARHAAVNRERLRIARDLHDTLAHSLMALLTQVRLVRKLRTRMGGDELDAELAQAEAVAASGLSGARAAIAQMRDNGVREAGLGAAVDELVRRFGQRTGLAVSASCDDTMSTWADERAETVFRIVEEALRNIERHARAHAVQVRLGCQAVAAEAAETARLAHVEVRDDGCGFDPAAAVPGHFGLRGMREQAALIDAALAVDSAPGRGTRVSLDFHA